MARESRVSSRRGRPKSLVRLDESLRTRAVELALEGLEVAFICAELGISEKALRRELTRNGAFRDALVAARRKADLPVLRGAYQDAITGKRPVDRIFWLKNRHPEYFGDRHEHRHQGQVTVRVVRGKAGK